MARRILAMFVVCAALPVGGLAVVSYRHVVRQLDAQERARLREESKSAGLFLFGRLSALEDEFSGLATRLGGRVQPPERTPASSVGPVSRRFRSASFELATGEVVPIDGGGTAAIPPPLSASQVAHIRSGQPLITTSVDQSEPVVYMARLRDSTDAASAIMWLEVSPAYLWGTDAEATSVPSNMQMCVLDQNADPLYCPQPALSSVFAGLPAQPSDEQGGHFEWSGEDDHYVAGYWPLYLGAAFGSPGWTIVLSESRSDILAPIASFQRALFLGVLLVLLVVLFLSHIQIRRTLTPLVALREATDRVAGRDFANPVQITSDDEFGDLAKSFNKMASRLQHEFRESDWLTKALSEAGEHLRQEETRLRTMLETAPDGIVTTDDRGLIESFNRTAETTFGYAGNEVLRKPFDILLSDGEGSALLGDMTGNLSPAGERREVTGKRKDGTAFPMELGASAARIGESRIFTVFLRDVTPRKDAERERLQLESQLRQAQKLETIGTLAGGIAHDFNNILSPIFGYVDMGLLDSDPGTQLHGYFGEIEQAAGRARDLVGQILLIGRRGEQERTPLFIAPIVKEALKLLRASVPTNIEIRPHIESDCAPVLADPTQIHQVLMNLCTNAVHAMREQENGALKVGLSMVHTGAGLTAANPDQVPVPCVCLTVSDTGCGMDAKTAERVFEPFYTTKAEGEGTGLGLSVVHGIVTNHGGVITVDSTLGRGTTVRVFLPVTNALVRSKKQTDGTQLTGHERVLLVDDDDQVAMVQSTMLRRLGYRVTVMTDSMEALAAFRTAPHSFDVVITDRTMPQMSGTTLGEKLREIRPDIRMILTTGYTSTTAAESARSLGFARVLSKPASLPELGKAIRQVLDGVPSGLSDTELNHT